VYAIDVSTFEITTDRLPLRPPREEDFPGWVAFAAEPAAMEFLGGVQEPSLVWRTFVGAVGGPLDHREDPEALDVPAADGAAAAIGFAVDGLGWDEVIHCIEEGNTASERVAEKPGSVRLRTARLPAPQEVEVVVWGQSAADWRTRRSGVS